MRLLRFAFGCFVLMGFVWSGDCAFAQEVREDTPVMVRFTPQEQGTIQQTERWINALTSLKAKFQQIAPDGKRSTGQVWIKRPGRIRFEYDKPSQLLLVANEGKMVFHDGAVDQTTVIPIDQNPLGLLLRPELNFSGDVMITRLEQGNGLIQITVVRKAAPSEGSLTLVFNQDPVQLKAWRVVDVQGQVTQVDLYDLHPKKSVSDSLFNIHFD